MTNTAKEFPDFFKVFLTEQHFDRMLIPVAFVKLMHAKRKVIKDFILRNHRGRDWNVKARRIGDKHYFEDGWKQLREENCLEENDFLIFTHVENNVFKFKILELSSMCEKIRVIIDEEENINMMENHVNDDGSDGNNDDDDDDIMMVEEDEVEENDDDDVAADYDEEYEDDYIMKEEEEEEVYEEVYKKCSINEPQHRPACKNYDIGSGSAGSKLKDEEYEEFKAEMYVQPGNPYFIAKPLHYRPNELHIPKNIIKDFCLCFTNYINLVCCHCKDIQSNEIADYHDMLPQMNTKHIEKRGKVCRWQNGRDVVQGWLDFCKKSKIRENDTCLCEVVLRDDNEAIEMLRVHVVKKE